MRLTLIAFSVCLFSVNAFCQSEKHNIPPGSKLKTKTNTEIDYSYKIQEIPNTVPINFEVDDFFKSYDKEELKEQESKSKDTKDYYTKASSFYSSLSNRVKSTFTVEELWYIYQFDQSLVNKLQNIK